MTFVDVITAMIIVVAFLMGFSQVILPACRAWENAAAEYRTGQTIHFIAESFRSECAKPERDMERWKKTAAATKELESYNLIEMRQEDVLRAIKAECVISGEYIEIIGLCTP